MAPNTVKLGFTQLHLTCPCYVQSGSGQCGSRPGRCSECSRGSAVGHLGTSHTPGAPICMSHKLLCSEFCRTLLKKTRMLCLAPDFTGDSFWGGLLWDGIDISNRRVPTCKILYKTTSSAAGSVASNLHWVMASAVACIAALTPDAASPEGQGSQTTCDKGCCRQVRNAVKAYLTSASNPSQAKYASLQAKYRLYISLRISRHAQTTQQSRNAKDLLPAAACKHRRGEMREKLSSWREHIKWPSPKRY